MAVYVVMEPPATVRREQVEGAVLVRDGFSFMAFLVPIVWLLARRLWIEALVALALTLAVGLAGTMSEMTALTPVLSLFLAAYFGLESNALRLAALRRRGWREWGLVEAKDRGEAELRYAAGLAAEKGGEPDQPAAPGPMAARMSSGPALGLLSYPDAR